MEILKQHENDMLKLEIINLQSKLEAKDKVIATLVEQIDNSPLKPIAIFKTPQTPDSQSQSQQQRLTSEIRVSPPRLPSPTQSIASTSGSNTGPGGPTEERLLKRARQAEIARQIERNDEIREEIRLGKRVKLEPGLQEEEDVARLGQAGPVPKEKEVVAEEEDVAPPEEEEDQEVPTPPEIPIIPAPVPTPARIPMEAKNGRVYEAKIYPFRISFPKDHSPGFIINHGKEHYFSIGWTRQNESLQCITIESSNEAGERSILLEFEPSALHSASHPDGHEMYTFSFNANANEVWSALAEFSGCPIPALDAVTPDVTFKIPDVDDSAIIEGMLETFVKSVPYTLYHNIELDIEESKAYVGGLMQHGVRNINTGGL